MKRILVPTDFSANSKAGLRFALQCSSQEPLELIFIHVVHIPRAIGWTDQQFLDFIETEKKPWLQSLEKFVSGVFTHYGMAPTKSHCVVVEGFSADLAILEYCENHRGIDLICMGTAGAGGLRTIIGTHTGNLITKSKIPVIAVPSTYRIKPITELLYATDLHDYKNELQRIATLAHQWKAAMDIIHFTWPDEILADRELIEAAMKKQFNAPLKLHFKQRDPKYSLIQNLQKEIEKLKPSIAIMFTDQDRNFLQKLILPSKAEQLSFHLTTPLLVFRKNHQHPHLSSQ